MQIGLADRHRQSEAERATHASVPGGRLLPVLTLLLFLLGWEAVVRLGAYPAFILPSPARVAEKVVAAALDGTLWRHLGVTLVEVLGGLAIGVSLAVVLGYAVVEFRAVGGTTSADAVAGEAY